MTPQALMTSTPNRYQQQQRTPTSSITHSNIKRFRPVMASQEGDHQQYGKGGKFLSLDFFNVT